MLESCIYNILDQILPVTDNPKHDILSLEYLSACQLMNMRTESDSKRIVTRAAQLGAAKQQKHFKKILQYLPASLFEPVLQSAIYDCYLKFTSSLDITTLNPRDFSKTEIQFPATLGILILNWPYEDFILRNQIPPLDPPVDIFPSRYIPVVSKKQAISQHNDMLLVFKIFCNKLIEFITQTLFKCPPKNLKVFSCNIRRLDVSGLGHFYSSEHLDDIFEVISNSTIDTFGHKIEFFADYIRECMYEEGFDIIRKIFEENLKPDIGISVSFKTFSAEWFNQRILPNDFYNVLALGGCKYIQLKAYGPIVDKSYAENLCVYLPGLVGIDLQSPRKIQSMDFLSSFEHLEQLRISLATWFKPPGLTKAICNLSKGLKYLNLSNCSLNSQDLECLANSMHSESLLQLDLTDNEIENDSEAVGLITLCQKLKIIKVLILDSCVLHVLSSNILSKLVNECKNCYTLEFLSMRDCLFSIENTHIIIDVLAQNKSLRYLCLNLPGEVTTDDIKRLFNGNNEYYDDDEDAVEPNNVDMEYLQNLFQTFNEKINKFRQSTINISWNIDHI